MRITEEENLYRTCIRFCEAYMSLQARYIEMVHHKYPNSYEKDRIMEHEKEYCDHVLLKLYDAVDNMKKCDKRFKDG